MSRLSGSAPANRAVVASSSRFTAVVSVKSGVLLRMRRKCTLRVPGDGLPNEGRPVAGTDASIDTLAGFALFADLERPALERVVHSAEEAWFPAGERIIREGLRGSGLHII